MTTFCFHEKLTQDTCQIKGRAELENVYQFKGNVWVAMSSYSNAWLILTSEMWFFEKLTTYFDI